MSRRSRYEEACDEGYDGPPPGSSRRGYISCGGWAEDGPCGAGDCPDCYPGSYDKCEEDEEDGSNESD
jgi:hypothetical protein